MFTVMNAGNHIDSAIGVPLPSIAAPPQVVHTNILNADSNVANFWAELASSNNSPARLIRTKGFSFLSLFYLVRSDAEPTTALVVKPFGLSLIKNSNEHDDPFKLQPSVLAALGGYRFIDRTSSANSTFTTDQPNAPIVIPHTLPERGTEGSSQSDTLTFALASSWVGANLGDGTEIRVSQVRTIHTRGLPFVSAMVSTALAGGTPTAASGMLMGFLHS